MERPPARAPNRWSTTTQKGNTVYLHVFEWKSGTVAIPKLPGKVKSASLLGRNVPVAQYERGDHVLLTIGDTRDPYDTVVKIELER